MMRNFVEVRSICARLLRSSKAHSKWAMVIFSGTNYCLAPARAGTLALVSSCSCCVLCFKLRAHRATGWGARRPTLVTILRLFPCNRLSWAVQPGLSVPRLKMSSDSIGEGKGRAPVFSESPFEQNAQARLKAIISDSTAKNNWDITWKENVTPWDIGSVTPVIQDLIDKGKLPDGRALVPGCGCGYDVLALASENRQVVGLDISETVNKIAQENGAENPNGKWVEFLVADFFDYKPEAPFNLIFDYTFFCAIDPSLRSAWAAKMADLLAPDGQLITLIFPLGEYDGGPPFAVSVKAYEEALNPHGFTMTSCEDNELAVARREVDFEGTYRARKWKIPLSSEHILLHGGVRKLLSGLGKNKLQVLSQF